MRKFNLLFVVLGFILFSCEYNPTIDYNLELEKKDAPEISIDLHLNNNEKIIFYDEQHSYFRLNLYSEDDIKIFDVKFYLDNKELSTFTSSAGEGYFSNVNLQDTLTHMFRVEFKTNSGSNSLADVLGYEGFMFSSREWMLIANQETEIDTGLYELTNEGALISWKPYDGINFKEYKIVKSITNTRYWTSTNKYLDYDYFGEEGHYYIYVVDNIDNEFLWGRVNIESNVPDLFLTEVDRKLALAWNKSGFEANIKEYQISSGEYHGAWKFLANVNSNKNYLILENYQFGYPKHFKIQAISKNNLEIKNNGLSSKYLFAYQAIPGPDFNSNYGATSKGVILEGYDSLYLYSTNTKSIKAIDLKYPSLVQSPDANYIINRKDNIINLHRFDDFEFIKELNVKKEVEAFYPYLNLKLSDNGILAFYLNSTLYLYDVENENIVVQKTFDRQYNVILSPDSKHVLLYNSDTLLINEITANSIKEINHFGKGNDWFRYDDFLLIPNAPDKLFNYDGTFINIKDITNFSTIRTFKVNGNFLFNIDFAKDKILSYSRGNFYIQKFSTGQLLEIIPSNLGGASNYTVLCDNIIFYSRFKYYLNN